MKKSILLAALFCLIIVLTSCSQPGEISVSKYFQAMKMNDKDTMSSMALEPKDLEFKSFEIVTIGEPEEKDLELPIFEQKMRDMIKEKTNLGNLAMDAQDELEDLKDELAETRRSSQKAQVQEKIKEAELVFAEQKQNYNMLLMNIAGLQKKISREKDQIRMSTGRTESLNLFTGKSFYQKVEVKVTLNNGDVNNYVFLLKKTDLTLEEKTIDGRLIIVKILSAADFEKEAQAEEAEAAAEKITEEITEEKTEEVSEDATAEEKNE